MLMFRTEVFKPWKLGLFSKVHDGEILGSQRSANVCISLCLLFLLSYIEITKVRNSCFPSGNMLIIKLTFLIKYRKISEKIKAIQMPTFLAFHAGIYSPIIGGIT